MCLDVGFATMYLIPVDVVDANKKNPPIKMLQPSLDCRRINSIYLHKIFCNVHHLNIVTHLPGILLHFQLKSFVLNRKFNSVPFFHLTWVYYINSYTWIKNTFKIRKRRNFHKRSVLNVLPPFFQMLIHFNKKYDFNMEIRGKFSRLNEKMSGVLARKSENN